MNFLLDVNVLLAWGWSDHMDHRRAASWIASICMGRSRAELLTSAIPELGFVRVSVQRAAGQLSVADAQTTLAGMTSVLGRRHRFLPDDLPSQIPFPQWCRSAAHTTDAHLLELAHRHQAALATLDSGIPGAYVIPVI